MSISFSDLENELFRLCGLYKHSSGIDENGEVEEYYGFEKDQNGKLIELTEEQKINNINKFKKRFQDWRRSDEYKNYDDNKKRAHEFHIMCEAVNNYNCQAVEFLLDSGVSPVGTYFGIETALDKRFGFGDIRGETRRNNPDKFTENEDKMKKMLSVSIAKQLYIEKEKVKNKIQEIENEEVDENGQLTRVAKIFINRYNRTIEKIDKAILSMENTIAKEKRKLSNKKELINKAKTDEIIVSEIVKNNPEENLSTETKEKLLKEKERKAKEKERESNEKKKRMEKLLLEGKNVITTKNQKISFERKDGNISLEMKDGKKNTFKEGGAFDRAVIQKKEKEIARNFEIINYMNQLVSEPTTNLSLDSSAVKSNSKVVDNILNSSKELRNFHINKAIPEIKEQPKEEAVKNLKLLLRKVYTQKQRDDWKIGRTNKLIDRVNKNFDQDVYNEIIKEYNTLKFEEELRFKKQNEEINNYKDFTNKKIGIEEFINFKPSTITTDDLENKAKSLNNIKNIEEKKYQLRQFSNMYSNFISQNEAEVELATNAANFIMDKYFSESIKAEVMRSEMTQQQTKNTPNLFV